MNNVRGRENFYKFKKWIILLSRFYSIFPLYFRKKLFEFHRMTKGLKGIVLRYALLKSIALQCGDNVSIYPSVYLLSPEKIIIGDNVSIHPMCYLDATGGIVIGNDVSIAHGASIMSTTHRYENINIPIKDQGIVLSKTIIKNNVWIGAKTTILSGILIESGSIIAANAVVTKGVLRNTIVAGIPAKKIKGR
ncbi:putative acetyltransferase [bioreactor metagenome]|uniref:Putative acetyltransferase n=1 Tax=bioreactor metagenome TaxID=1076179 RepID=A0A645E448_9ZZZZ